MGASLLMNHGLFSNQSGSACKRNRYILQKLSTKRPFTAKVLQKIIVRTVSKHGIHIISLEHNSQVF